MTGWKIWPVNCSAAAVPLSPRTSGWGFTDARCVGEDVAVTQVDACPSVVTVMRCCRFAQSYSAVTNDQIPARTSVEPDDT